MQNDYNTPRFTWEERYLIGIPSIDDAHEEMFKVINRVYRMIRIGGNVKWTVAEAIKFFKAYTTRHFEDEEAFMRSVGYTRYAEHKAIHDGCAIKLYPASIQALRTANIHRKP